MRFLIDAHHLGSRATGNETWARETLDAMLVEVTRAGSPDELFVATRFDVSSDGVRAGWHDRIGSGQIRRLAWDLPRLARQRRVDALLVQYTGPLSRVPLVVAIHDLSFTDPASRSWIPPRERARMNITIRWSARRAARVLALSEYTARDLQEKWGIDQDRIVVARPAVAPHFEKRLKRALLARKPSPEGRLTVLMVGNVLPRKNHQVVARAVRILRERGLPVALRIAGQVPHAGRAPQAELARIGTEWLTVTGYLNEDALAREYVAADVLCFPSLYEGFGIPVLEAMASDLPVIVSNRTALPEAAGAAGSLVDAVDDPLEWADVLETVLTDPGRAQAMRSAGREHLTQFSWGRTGAHALQALRQAGS